MRRPFSAGNAQSEGVYTFFVFSARWNIAEAKILQGADFGRPMVECLLRDGAHWHQKDAKVGKRGKGVVLHERASERRSHEAESSKSKQEGHVVQLWTPVSGICSLRQVI